MQGATAAIADLRERGNDGTLQLLGAHPALVVGERHMCPVIARLTCNDWNVHQRLRHQFRGSIGFTAHIGQTYGNYTGVIKHEHHPLPDYLLAPSHLISSSRV